MTPVRPVLALLLIAPLTLGLVGCEPPVETTGNGGADAGGDPLAPRTRLAGSNHFSP